MKKKTKKIGEARIYDPVGKQPFPKKSSIEEIIETKYCGNDCCDSEASFITSNGMPLCDSCAEMYRLGQDNPEPLEQI